MFNSFTLSRTKTLFAVALIFMFASSLGQRYFGHDWSRRSDDFYVYFFAGQLVHEAPKAPLYENAFDVNPQVRPAPAGTRISQMAKRSEHAVVDMYIYPSLLADLLSLCWRMDPAKAADLWRFGNLLMVLFSAFVVTRILDLKALSANTFLVFSASFLYFPIVESLALGQITIVLLGLWAAGLWCYKTNRFVASGFFFAIATALKVTPILILPLFLLWGRKRWVLAYALSLCSLIAAALYVNGWNNAVDFCKVMRIMSSGAALAPNKSLSAMTAWIYYGKVLLPPEGTDALPNPPNLLSFLSKLISLTYYMVCLLLVYVNRATYSFKRQIETISVFSIITMLVSPVSWRHGYAIAFLPLSLLWADVLDGRRSKTSVILLTLTTLVAGSIFLDSIQSLQGHELLKIASASVEVLSFSWLCIASLQGRKTPVLQ